MTQATSTHQGPADAVADIVLNPAQAKFVRYFTAILIDLVVLNLFAEHWDAVYVENFTVTLGAALLLQVLLKFTIAVEHRVGNYWNAQSGAFATFMRYFSAWFILFGSKFLIIQAVGFTFGGAVAFHGMLHGIVAIIVVLMVMVLAELGVVRIFNRLGEVR